jgi:hypothetical protein
MLKVVVIELTIPEGMQDAELAMSAGLLVVVVLMDLHMSIRM